MLQFPYQDERLSGPPPPSVPATAVVRSRPLIPVTIIGPNGQRRFFPRALLDPGADDTIFPISLAGLLAVALRADTGHGVRWRGQAYGLRFGDVRLELSDGPQVWCWPAVIGFSPAPIRYPILGLAGCLEFFDARFRGVNRTVELEINSSYPGKPS